MFVYVTHDVGLLMTERLVFGVVCEVESWTRFWRQEICIEVARKNENVKVELVVLSDKQLCIRCCAGRGNWPFFHQS